MKKKTASKKGRKVKKPVIIDGIKIYCDFSEIVEIEKLIPHPRNPNTHPDKQIEMLAKIYQHQGWRGGPITISTRSGFMVRGHGRRLSAFKAGMKSAPVTYQDYDNEAAEYADLMADNLIADMAIMENKLVSELVIDIDKMKIPTFDMELTGITMTEIEQIRLSGAGQDGGTGSGEPPEPPPVPQNPVTKLGDIWILGNHRLLCGDATKIEDVNRLMDGKKADIVFTDPPYGVSYADKNKFLNSLDKGNRCQKPIEQDHVSEKEIQKFWKKAFEVIRDSLAPVNSYYITGPQIQGMMMMMMMMMMQEAGLPYRHVIIWVKNNHVLGRCDYNYKHEPIFFGWTTTHKFYGKGPFLTSVWPVDKPHKSDLHPTMKPVELIENALLNSSMVGQICLDTFMGSGSTLMACERLNRICMGLELDPQYCDVICQRWMDYTQKSPIRESDGVSYKKLVAKK